MNAVSPERNYAIDWLRIFAMFTVFLFHCARFFDRDDRHVKNPQSDTILTFVVLILVQWIMPLFLSCPASVPTILWDFAGPARMFAADLND